MENVNQKIQLVKGNFTAAQASDIIISLINKKITYHKVEAVQLWEKDHNSDQEHLHNRVEELELEKKNAKEFFERMEEQGKTLKIDSIIEMSVVD